MQQRTKNMDTRSAVKRRVVVTGMGAVSPNGIGREAFWNATRRGQSGVRRISRFDPSSHKVQIAGEVTDFDESVFVAPKERQHVSRAVPLAVAASREAVTDAGIEPKRMSREQLRTMGVLIGSGGGSQEFTEEQYRLYYSGHEKQCSVYAVPTGTIGTLASEVSMRFGFRGPSHITPGASRRGCWLAERRAHRPLIVRGFKMMRTRFTPHRRKRYRLVVRPVATGSR